MNNNTDYKTRLLEIKVRIASGGMSIEEARVLAIPILKEMNEKAISIANQFGVKHKDITFTQVFR